MSPRGGVRCDAYTVNVGFRLTMALVHVDGGAVAQALPTARK